MTGGIAARRYARALFDLGRKKGLKEMDAYGSDLAALAALVDASADLSRLFRDPVFTPEEKRRVLTALADRLKISLAVRDFVYLLADKGRLELIKGIAGEYQTLADAEKGILRGELVTAVPLEETKRGAIQEKLEEKAGRSLALSYRVDEAVLGGMVLTIGDTVFDASLRAQLSLLHDTIKRGE